MKKLFIAILILAITRLGVTYAAPNSNSIQNFFLGNSLNQTKSYNQVLALLVGPRGKPGAAGVAGRDGINGLNGINGRDGLPGAPGPVGPQGLIGPQGPQGPKGDPGERGAIGPQGIQGIPGPAGAPGANGAPGVNGLSVQISNASISECPNGGTKFSVGSSVSYACNGSNSGASGGTSVSGVGQVNLTTCDRNKTVNFRFSTIFKNADFFLDKVLITGVDEQCTGSKLQLFFKITNPLNSNTSVYLENDLMKCSITLSGGTNPKNSTEGNTEYSYEMPSNQSCDRSHGDGSTATSIELGKIGSRDVEYIIGFEIVSF